MEVDVRTVSVDRFMVLDEDADALALQQVRLAKRPQEEPDVLIGQDAGVAKARRIMHRLLVAEAAQSAQPAPSS